MTQRSPRGLSLVEAMVAMVVLLIGSLGLLSLNSTSQRMNGDARRMTRATAMAQDLLNQIETWDYASDVRLLNAKTENDADIGDGTFQFEKNADPLAANFADHGEADLALGPSWNGIPVAELQNGGYQRFWNIAEPDDANANGIKDGKRIAVIVRWPYAGAYRRIVLLGMLNNPAEAQ